MACVKTERMTAGLRLALIAIAVLHLAAFGFVAISRMSYPFELEWMEGASLMQVHRILAGRLLYAPPTLEFVPSFYTPLYFYVCAPLAAVLGSGFFPLRLVSALATLGCFALIHATVRRETRDRFAAFIAASLFIATFRASGAWFDLARVDSLFLFFLLGAFYLIRFGERTRSWVAAAVLITLAYLTKQTALIVALPVCFYAFLTDRRRSFAMGAALLASLALATVALNALHDGWYLYYVQKLPVHQPSNPAFIGRFWSEDVMGAMAIASLMAVWLFVNPDRSQPRSRRFYLLMTCGALAGSWMSRLNIGGYENVLMPAYAALAIVFGVALASILKSAQDVKNPRRKAIETFLYIACLLQFTRLVYRPSDQIPTREDAEAGRELVGRLAQTEGPVLVPFHPYLLEMAGKPAHAHGIAISDVVRGDPGPLRTQMIESMRDLVRRQAYSAIIVDNQPWPYEKDLRKHYRFERRIVDGAEAFWPRTGWPTRPQELYVPKPQAAIASKP